MAQQIYDCRLKMTLGFRLQALGGGTNLKRCDLKKRKVRAAWAMAGRKNVQKTQKEKRKAKGGNGNRVSWNREQPVARYYRRWWL